jgi:cell wall-associated NlpC family hydrolase
MSRRALRRRVPILAAAVLTVLSATSGNAVALTDTVPAPREPPRDDRRPGLSSVVAAARDHVGATYAMGAAGPGAFDCSGLTMVAFQKAGIALPHSSFGQYAMGRAVDRGGLRAGDLVFFSTAGPGASHVGIASGRGTVISATSSGVMEHSLSDAYWGAAYVGARRLRG